ncbi:hypothetical protein [Novosphingobium sp. JCM 18896]|uniref:hypothetical protein n=1 Tax=Novosphingobium sp. JCM 18896 TaxID=2989731 RepID=UPI0022239381|nr:hypothetical protein [Novosphingobium sp. JCM 18896]MCW1432263.1 hypothetical protein [Novosphingobium sp. JCM 18896]
MRASPIEAPGTLLECIGCATALLDGLDRLAETLDGEQTYYIKIAAIHALQCRELLNDAVEQKP